MSDWPAPRNLDLAVGGTISVASIFSGPITNVAPASTAWPSANLAIFVPFQLTDYQTVTKIIVGAGATAAGNFDVGIYDSTGNRIVSSGATAKGASTEHIIDITDTALGPGLYYMAMAADGTNNYVMWTPSGTSPVPLQKARLVGVLNVASAYTLPSSVTLAAASSALVPSIALYLRSY